MRRTRIGLTIAALIGLAGCATEPEVVLQPSRETLTALGRYPARNHGILIAQNAALQEGRSICQSQGLRFRPVGSVAGEDPATGEAVYAVRFLCMTGRRAQAERPEKKLVP